MRRGSRAASIAYVLVNVMLFVLLAGVVVGVVALAHGLVSGGSVPVHAKLLDSDSRALPPGVKMVNKPEVALEIEDASTKQQLLSAATAVGPALLLACGIWLLRGLAGSVRHGDPFEAANVRRLRQLGFLLVVGAPAAGLANWALRIALVDTLPHDAFGGLSFQAFAFPFTAVFAGLGALILAEVFAYGVSLREDVEATI
jgi:Protein of unknown function (DUF2975)